MQETAVGYLGHRYRYVSVPVHPPAILAHTSAVVAGPNAEEFDAIPKNTRQNK